MKKGSIPHQIIGSFEDIGKSIFEETAKVPSSLVDTAVSPGQSENKLLSQDNNVVREGFGKPNDPNSALSKFGEAKKIAVRQAFARAALRELSGNTNTEEVSVYDERMKEIEAKKQKQNEENNAQDTLLKPLSTKAKRGDPYAARAKAKNIESKPRGNE